MVRHPLRLSLLTASIGMALAASASAQSLNGQANAAAQLAADFGAAPKVSYHPGTRAANFVRIGVANKMGASSAAAAGTSDAAMKNGAQQFFNSYGAMFGIKNAATELVASASVKDQLGGARVRHAQVYQGVPVFGAELRTHYNASGSLVAVNGNFVPDIEISTTPGRSASDASAAALKHALSELTFVPKAKVTAGAPQLMVYNEGLIKGTASASRLAWVVKVGNGMDVRDTVIVDAQSGKVLNRIAGIHEAKNRRAFDSMGLTQPGPNYSTNPFWVEGQPFPTGTTEADNMIAASGETYDLFKVAFGRDSFDGNGATMDSIFNRGNGCPNASWNGLYISFCPGTTTDDVTAHEWAHAYTEYTHGLIYQWQPGALNEAYSDIWGETIDRINGRGGDTPDGVRTADSCTTSSSVTRVVISAPSSIAGAKAAGTAAFGPQTFNLAAADVVVVNDGVGAATDGCQAPFANAAAIAGKIAFMDRGSCGFSVKAANAEAAGAIGVIIGNNQAGAFNMAVTPGTVNTIPALSVLQSDGTAIKANSGVKAALQRGPGSDVSVRWLVGEDSSAFGGAIRDMYNPTCYGHPGKVSDAQYVCVFAGDNGGVHTNSGVPNHGYALLVDGGTYNGQTINAIGLTKAAHIYWRAQSTYQGPASGFVEHADALQQSCTDLTGVNLKHLKTGAPSGEIITAADCDQVAKMALAVELRSPPSQCTFTSVLAKSPPSLCGAGSTPTAVASDTFEGGKRASMKWLLSNQGVEAGAYQPRNFGVLNKLPGGRAGYAMWAADPDGSCSGTGSQAGVQRLDTPELTIPATATNLRMTFDHFVATEAGWDGGNVKISVNGGAWMVVAAGDFIYNPYNGVLNTAAAGNDNPMAGQPAFTGTDGGSVTGSWGRSIINLFPYAKAGDKVKIRFEMGNDCGFGSFGWYIDDVQVYTCTANPT